MGKRVPFTLSIGRATPCYIHQSTTQIRPIDKQTNQSRLDNSPKFTHNNDAIVEQWVGKKSRYHTGVRRCTCQATSVPVKRPTPRGLCCLLVLLVFAVDWPCSRACTAHATTKKAGTTLLHLGRPGGRVVRGALLRLCPCPGDGDDGAFPSKSR